MLVVAAAMLFLAGAPDPQVNEVDPAIIEPRKEWRVVPTDGEIVAQLNQLVLDEPNRIVCFRPPARIGTRLTHKICRTLAGWYQFERDRDPQARISTTIKKPPYGPMLGPPYELVDMIKARYPSPEARASARAHGLQRATAPRSASGPLIANP